MNDEPCPHGVPYGCPECIMRKGNAIANALAMLDLPRWRNPYSALYDRKRVEEEERLFNACMAL